MYTETGRSISSIWRCAHKISILTERLCHLSCREVQTPTYENNNIGQQTCCCGHWLACSLPINLHYNKVAPRPGDCRILMLNLFSTNRNKNSEPHTALWDPSWIVCKVRINTTKVICKLLLLLWWIFFWVFRGTGVLRQETKITKKLANFSCHKQS